MNHHINIVRIKSVANALTGLNTKVVFVGGTTVSLYPDRPVYEIRPTDDVDVIIEILNYAHRTKIEEKLITIGFALDIESGIICRYKVDGIIVDIMPTHDSSIGITNKWYPKGFENAVDFIIDEKLSIQILAAPYFIATKLEAFKARGDNDGRTSQDFEDIVYVLENRSSIWNEMSQSDNDLKKYLLLEFQTLLQNPHLWEWIDCHVERNSPPATNFIIEQLQQFSE